jgi:predicted metal-dependent phosphoesterase TrpH
MLIEMHTHTTPFSRCGRMSARDLIRRAKALSIDAVCVTEHMVIGGADAAQEIGDEMSYPVFRGVEAACTIWGDVLVYGCYQDLALGIEWHELRDTVLGLGGVLIPAHPFRRKDTWALWKFLEDQGLSLDEELVSMDFVQGLTAIETSNGGALLEENEQAECLARLLGLPAIGGSDAHSVEQVGRTLTEFPHRISSDAELVAALKTGDFWPVRREFD